MKKLVAIVLAVAIAASLCGCADKSARAVDKQIQEIGEVTSSSQDAINSARAAYEALPDESKENVENLSVLQDAEEICAVEVLIDSIGEISDDSESRIQAAEDAYSALNDTQKNSVNNYNHLLEARATFDKLPKGVELTAGNITDYLSINVSCNNKRAASTVVNLYKSNADLTIDIYPTRGGTFENTKIVLIYWIKNGWKISSADSAYKYVEELKEEYEGYVITEIELPADGKYSETHTITASATKDLPEDTKVTNVGDVKGSLETNEVGWMFVSSYLPEGTPLVTGTFKET